ncbi:MAG: response regulator [Planctomycetes bacterium]|nr:response regulator [Planctomycetota bacterium]
MRKRILIVDPDQFDRAILRKILGGEYELAEATSGEECLLRMRDFGPDLVLLDTMMPGIDGYEVCRQIKQAPHGDLTLVALVSGRASTTERLRGYEAGADDFIVKPFDHGELAARVKILFRLRRTLTGLARANAEIEVYTNELEQLVQERTAEVVETRDVTVFALAKLAESRDPETGKHLERMRCYSRILAQELADQQLLPDEVNEEFVRHLYMASPLHDIGKVGIPDVILLKPGLLSAREFEIMRRHTRIGAEALEEAAAHTRSGGFLSIAATVARSHHERYDGTGYPDGLSGSDIPIGARIVALADVYDALTSVRVYKAAYDPEVARAMIEAEEGKYFDPMVVAAFRTRYDQFLQVCRKSGSAKEALLNV